MTAEAIKVFCRVKPVLGRTTTVEYDVDNELERSNGGTFEVYVPEDFSTKQSQNTALSHKFTFNRIFDQQTAQKEVYDHVARPVVENALEGYNGTVFVYGQTATGKTYTILGDENDENTQKKGKKKKRKRRPKPTAKVQPDPDTENLRPEDTAVNGQSAENGQVIKEKNENAELLEVDKKTETTDKNTPEQRSPDIPLTSGIVPRTLSHIFEVLASYEAETEIGVSYYEIYKESGYDLLNGKRGSRRVSDIKQLPQIKAMTDRKHELHLRNLSRHAVKDQQEALELLEHGNANRQVAETHLNEASSRSHCIFTIYLTIKQPERQAIIQPKIHLVDLAGSERFGKSHETSDRIMSEGRNINLSLHHLQQVIVALSKKKATRQQRKHHHVPYRNSTMTLVLSDSLGGNSYTSMIATISAEIHNLEETLSTCRFAQQVATISNKVIVNEVEDADLIIARLKEELEAAKRQITSSATESPSFVEIEPDKLDEMIQEYLEDEDEQATLDVGTDPSNTQYCFSNLKGRFLEQLDENGRLQTELEAARAVTNKKSKTCVIM